MTHEEFVSLETAKLLKKAGFDWECRYYYDTWASPTLFDDRTGELQYELRTGTMGTDIVPKNYNDRPDGAFASAPTQAVAQRWLRKKGYNVQVNFDYFEDAPEAIYSVWSYEIEEMTLQAPYPRHINDSQFNTYEAALEAGLQKCLTLIIEKQC